MASAVGLVGSKPSRIPDKCSFAFADIFYGREGGLGDLTERLFEEARVHEAACGFDA